MASLSREAVLKLASLAKLALTEDEIATYRHELSDILGYVEQLQSVEIGDTPPTYQVTGLVNVSRRDEIIDYGLSREDLLKNAPAQQDGLIKVKRVLG